MSCVLPVSTMNPSLSWNSIVPKNAWGWSESFRSVSFQAYLDQMRFDSVTRVSIETICQSFPVESVGTSFRGRLFDMAGAFSVRERKPTYCGKQYFSETRF